MEWISVQDRLPEHTERVLITDGKVILRAQYSNGRSLIAFEGDGRYNEDDDEFYCEEGWYETNENEEIHWAVGSLITHWMYLPKPPKQ